MMEFIVKVRDTNMIAICRMVLIQIVFSYFQSIKGSQSFFQLKSLSWPSSRRFRLDIRLSFYNALRHSGTKLFQVLVARHFP